MLHPTSIKVTTGSQNPRTAAVLYQQHEGENLIRSYRGAHIQTNAQQHEVNNMFNKTENIMSPDHPRRCISPNKPEIGNLWDEELCQMWPLCLGGGISFPFLHHQLVNLHPPPQLIEFILIVRKYRRSWMGQSIQANTQCWRKQYGATSLSYSQMTPGLCYFSFSKRILDFFWPLKSRKVPFAQINTKQ